MTPKMNWPVTVDTLGLALDLTLDHALLGISEDQDCTDLRFTIYTEKGTFLFGPSECGTHWVWRDEWFFYFGESHAVTLGQLGRDFAEWVTKEMAVA